MRTVAPEVDPRKPREAQPQRAPTSRDQLPHEGTENIELNFVRSLEMVSLTHLRRTRTSGPARR